MSENKDKIYTAYMVPEDDGKNISIHSMGPRQPRPGTSVGPRQPAAPAAPAPPPKRD